MKKRFLLAAFAWMSVAVNSANAQSWSWFYTQDHHARSIANSLNGEYYSVETVDLGGSNGLAMSHYDATGILLNSFTYNVPGFSEQAAAIVTPQIFNGKMVIVSNPYDAGSNASYIRIFIADPFGGVGQERLIKSNHPSYNSLSALDAKWDDNLQQFVLCGFTFRQNLDGVTDRKEAFVMTLDQNFNILNMHHFNSATGSGGTDYDIANRVVVTSSGKYYVTGSENIVKWGTYYNMGVRNMLIDPVSLDFSSGGWSQPFTLKTDMHECGVDMAENTAQNEFVTVINMQQEIGWAIVRIDPNTGNPIFGNAENTVEPGFAHSITAGNGGMEYVVHGMRYDGTCNQWNPSGSGIPFQYTFDVSSYPATSISRTAFNTAVGNVNGSTSYWTLGGFYATLNSYPLPVYLNRFAERKSVGADYGLLTGILDQSGSFQNTKFLWVDPNGNNQCPIDNCINPLNDYWPIMPMPQGNDYPFMASVGQQNVIVNPRSPYAKDDCFNGYYRMANEEGASAQAVSKLSVYPNPATDRISIDIPADITGKVVIDLLDIRGSNVMKIYDADAEHHTTVSYDLPQNLANGTYIVQVAYGSGAKENKRVVINR